MGMGMKMGLRMRMGIRMALSTGTGHLQALCIILRVNTHMASLSLCSLNHGAWPMFTSGPFAGVRPEERAFGSLFSIGRD